MDLPHLAKHERRVPVEVSLPVFYVIFVVRLHRMQKRKQWEGMFQRIRIMALWNLEPERPLYRNTWVVFVLLLGKTEAQRGELQALCPGSGARI